MNTLLLVVNGLAISMLEGGIFALRGKGCFSTTIGAFLYDKRTETLRGCKVSFIM